MPCGRSNDVPCARKRDLLVVLAELHHSLAGGGLGGALVGAFGEEEAGVVQEPVDGSGPRPYAEAGHLKVWLHGLVHDSEVPRTEAPSIMDRGTMAQSNWRLQRSGLLIRDFDLEDITAAYVAGLNDKMHMQFSRQSLFRHTYETQLAYVHEFSRSPHYLLALQLMSSPTVLGSVTVHFALDRSSADLGVMVLPGNIGRGFGRTAWCAVVERLSTEVSFVTAGCARNNESMKRLMSAADMSPYAVRESELDTALGCHDAVYYRREFEGLPTSGTAQDRVQ